jgi:tetratricopeptide (TPR) repeat protein
VQPVIGLYFGDDPPEQTPAMLRLGRQNIDIPAGEKRYTVTDSFVLPVEVDVVAVQPHAHYRAAEMNGFATLPDGMVRPLIHIKQWDFRWQHVYRYATPVRLPKGATLSMRYTYDNSADNPRNPVQPPRRVYWGQRSADEMGDLWLQVVTRNDRDLRVLNDQFRPKVVAEDVVGYERWLESEPASVALHDDVALLYLEAKRPADAVRHFAQSVQLNPGTPAAHFNLGTALTLDGRLDEAMRAYRTALQLNPRYAEAHNNLGSVLLRTGKTADARDHFDQALAIDGTNPQAHYNAGAAARVQGRTAAAIGHFRQALKLGGEQPAILTDLAWLLATAVEEALREPAQAVRLSERAAELTARTDAAALDVLAAAYAATGEFDRAVDAGEAALRLGPPNAAAIRDRVDLYRAKQPYRSPRADGR